jgi:electron transfer flavoprotein alpha subunit
MPPADQAKASGILIIGEMINESPVPLVAEMLGLARQLVGEGKGAVSVLVIGKAAAPALAELVAAGADRVYVAATDAEHLYESDVWLGAVREVLTKFAPQLILAGHTSLGADLAPRLAIKLDIAIATGCEALAQGQGHILATRPCFGHKAREVLSLRTSPAIATVRARSSESLQPDQSRLGEVITIPMSPLDTSSTPRIKSRQRDDQSQGLSLERAKVIVAGGRGLGGPEGFAELAKLAETLGGVVGASRVACDLGWCPHSWQIGLTGKTVTPALYVAIGISGASHHMAGCGNSGAILAINSDPEAAIFKEARFGVVGDYKQIVPALVKELADFKSQGPNAAANVQMKGEKNV